MSGHNKWSKIKNRKAVTDAEKSKIFGKYARLIALESKKVKGDVNAPTLKAVIERARGENMPYDNIERAVKKGAGNESDNLEEVIYETYGPAGVAILIETLTDNRNRTAQEIKHLLSEAGFSLAAPGSASWAFKKDIRGYEASSVIDLSAAEKTALENLLEHLDKLDDVQDVYTNAAE